MVDGGSSCIKSFSLFLVSFANILFDSSTGGKALWTPDDILSSISVGPN